MALAGKIPSRSAILRASKQVRCSVVGVASPAGRFTALVCSLGVTLFYGQALHFSLLINKLGSSSALRADSLPRKFIN